MPKLIVALWTKFSVVYFQLPSITNSIYLTFVQGNLNLITQALEAVGCKMQVVPDPTTVHFHLPNNLSVRVHREYDKFIEELTCYFPHEKEGILKFYGVCWKVCLNWGDCSPLKAFLPQLVIHFVKSLPLFWLDFQCPEFVGIEVTRGTALPFWTVFSEAAWMLDTRYFHFIYLF